MAAQTTTMYREMRMTCWLLEKAEAEITGLGVRQLHPPLCRSWGNRSLAGNTLALPVLGCRRRSSCRPNRRDSRAV